MSEASDSKRLTFSIRSLLIVTAIVALHIGVPILGRALFATIAAAIVLILISVVPFAAMVAIWHLVKFGKLTHDINPPEWIGGIYFIILILVYIGVAFSGLIQSV